MPVRHDSVYKHALHPAHLIKHNPGDGRASFINCLHWCMQRCIAGLLLVSAAAAAVLSAQPHPYSAVFPKRILLQHVVRLDNATQVISPIAELCRCASPYFPRALHKRHALVLTCSVCPYVSIGLYWVTKHGEGDICLIGK